jgi:bifunctional non-homologous end joining protein LigD
MARTCELNGEDLRGLPIEKRKRELLRVLKKASSKIVFNEHYEAEGSQVFKEACALGCEGIVSKKLGSPYRSGRSDTWLKVKNPAAPAVIREAEEEWRT